MAGAQDGKDLRGQEGRGNVLSRQGLRCRSGQLGVCTGRH